MKKLFVLMGMYCALAVLPGCNKDDCGNGPVPPYYDITGLSANQVMRSDTALVFYDPIFLPVDTAVEVPARKFGIILNASLFYYFADANARSNMGGVAYACSPAFPGNMGTQERIADIQITSTYDFDAAHPAGSELRDLFWVSAGLGYQSQPPYDMVQSPIPLASFVAQQPQARSSLQLWLRHQPSASNQHRFKVIYRHTSGEEFIVHTPTVTFH